MLKGQRAFPAAFGHAEDKSCASLGEGGILLARARSFGRNPGLDRILIGIVPSKSLRHAIEPVGMEPMEADGFSLRPASSVVSIGLENTSGSVVMDDGLEPSVSALTKGLDTPRGGAQCLLEPQAWGDLEGGLNLQINLQFAPMAASDEAIVTYGILALGEPEPDHRSWELRGLEDLDQVVDDPMASKIPNAEDLLLTGGAKEHRVGGKTFRLKKVVAS
jgi:hypothetical protein